MLDQHHPDAAVVPNCGTVCSHSEAGIPTREKLKEGEALSNGLCSQTQNQSNNRSMAVHPVPTQMARSAWSWERRELDLIPTGPRESLQVGHVPPCPGLSLPSIFLCIFSIFHVATSWLHCPSTGVPRRLEEEGGGLAGSLCHGHPVSHHCEDLPQMPRSLVPDYASIWKQSSSPSPPPALSLLPEHSPFPVSLSSAAPGTPLSAYFTSVSLSNSRLFQQQNLMETNSVQGSIMGLFSYLWTEYFPLKDANDSLRDKLIKTPAKSRGKESLKCSRSPPRTRLPPPPVPFQPPPLK